VTHLQPPLASRPFAAPVVAPAGLCGLGGSTQREAILWIARTGCPWRDLPQYFGHWNNVYKRFARWCETGVWETVFAELSAGGDFEMVMLDSTIVRAHQHAAGAQTKRVIKPSGDLVAA
jgi:putative transposase